MNDVWHLICDLLPPRDLSRCESVSKEWSQRVRTMQSKWKHIDFSKEFEKAGTSEEDMNSILARCGDSLLSVRFGKEGIGRFACYPSNIHLNRHHMDNVTRQRRLKTFVAHRMIMTLAALERLQYMNSNLEEFELSYCRYDVYTAVANDIVQSSLVEMLRKCSRLTKFIISGRGQWSDHITFDERILGNLPKSLRVLEVNPGDALIPENMDFLRGMTLDTLRLHRLCVHPHHLQVLLTMTESLQELDLSYMSCSNDFTIIGKLPRLRKVTLDGNRMMTDNCLITITHGCPSLRHLSLENCLALTQMSLFTIGVLYELESLNIGGIPAVNDDVIDHVSNCVHLEKVGVSGCRHITSFAIELLLDLPSLSHFSCREVPAMTSALLSRRVNLPQVLERDPENLKYLPQSRFPLSPGRARPAHLIK